MVHQFAVSCEGRSRESFQLDDPAVRITGFIAGPSRDIAVGRIMPAVELALPGRAESVLFPRARLQSEVYPGNLSPNSNNLEIDHLNSVIQEFGRGGCSFCLGSDGNPRQGFDMSIGKSEVCALLAMPERDS